MMEVASIPPGMDAYEDMFKEITRKLYGDETVSSDYNYSASYSVSLTAASAGALPHPPANGTGHPSSDDAWFNSDENLEWTASKIASYNPVQKLYRCVDCDCCGFLARVAEHWLGTHANLRVFECPQCPYASAWARCVRMHLSRQHNAPEQNTMWKESPVLGEVTEYLNRLRDRVEADDPDARGRPARCGASPSGTSPTGVSPTAVTPPQPRDPEATEAPAPGKRYSCSSCPYTTDRRDLYTRHEAIHREEKPFHCYICQKQFNRADHVKKHFLRMHRDHPYDLNRIRRNHNSNSSPKMAYYGKYDSPTSQNNDVLAQTGLHHLAMPPNQIQQQTGNHALNIPTANFPSSNTRLATSNGDGDLKSPSQIGGMPSILDTTKMTDKMETRLKPGKEKRYSCCYCNWTGVDNWCLKRHLNTHLKPFVCTLCEYKAARSERLATHVLKVHNKRTCGRCNFMADDIAQLTIHQQEHHGQLPAQAPELAPNTVRNFRRALKRGAWGVGTTNEDVFHGGTGAYPRVPGAYPRGPGTYAYQPAMQQAPLHHPPPVQQNSGPRRVGWRKKANGADRLFNYMEASDSEEDEAYLGGGEDCPHCGCHFVDDLALQTHMVTHHRMGQAPGRPYRCSICGYNSASQGDIVTHMQRHTAIELRCPEPSCRYVTTYQEAMEEHTRLAHPPLPPLEQKCPHCGFVVLSGIALSRHAKAHHVASADCSGCNRVHSRFERHRSGETWAMSDDEERSDEQQAVSEEEKKATGRQMRLVRARTRAYKRRFWRSRRLRAAARCQSNKPKQPQQSLVKRLRHKYRRVSLFRRRYSCYTCNLTRRSIVPVHTSGTLALHRLWRHAHERYPCDSCELRFPRRYQVLLHAARDHSRCPSAASINAAIVEPIVTLTVPQVPLVPLVPLAPPEIIEDPTPPPQPQTCLKVPQQPPPPMHQTHHQMQPHMQQHIQPQQYGHPQVAQHHMGLPNGGYHTGIHQETYPYHQGPPPPLPPPPQQQQQHFHSSMYMVPKQMWYPQLPGPSYYLPTPFPPS